MGAKGARSWPHHLTPPLYTSNDHASGLTQSNWMVSGSNGMNVRLLVSS